MAFLSPLFLISALAAGLPVLLHLLRREPEQRVKFSAVQFLTHAPIEHASRRRLRELLLLALRVGTLLLLAFAFARPFLVAGAAVAGGTTVVALDVSSSMSAPGQFDNTRRLANEAVDQAGLNDAVAVVSFADGAQVVSQPSADRSAAKSAIRALQPGAGRTRYRAGVNAAVDLMRGRPGRVVVVTDLQSTGWDPGDHIDVPASVTIEVADAGAQPANLAVTGIRVSAEHVVGTIMNTGDSDATARVTLRAGNAQEASNASNAPVAGETTVPVAAHDTATVSFPQPRGQWAALTVDDRSGAQADNARFIVLDAAARPTVLAITTAGDLTREAFYLQQALEAGRGDGGAYVVQGVAAGDLASWNQARFDALAAVFLTSTRALEHHGRELLSTYLKHGGGMVVAAGPDLDGDVVQEILGGPKVSITAAANGATRESATRTWGPSDVRHPVVKAFGSAQGALGLVQFRSVASLRTTDCPVLARFTTGELALVECASGPGRALILASDLDNRGNDFPLHATFVPFLHESVRYLTGGRQHASDVFVADAPAGASPAPGIATVGSGDAATLVAINIDPAEVEPGRLSSEQFTSPVSAVGSSGQSGDTSQEREQEERQHIWQYVLAAALVLMMAESWVAAKVA